VIGEIVEEEVGKALRAGVKLEDYRLTTGKELLAEAIAFSVPGAASLSLQVGSEFAAKRSERKLTPEQRAIEVEALRLAGVAGQNVFTAEELETDEGLADFAFSHPLEAQVIAGKSTASQDDFAIGLAKGEKLTTKQRTSISQRMREILKPDLMKSSHQEQE